MEFKDKTKLHRHKHANIRFLEEEKKIWTCHGHVNLNSLKFLIHILYLDFCNYIFSTSNSKNMYKKIGTRTRGLLDTCA